MTDPTHPREQLFRELEELAERATPGPWEPELSIDVARGDAHRTVVHYPAGTHVCVPVASREAELSEGDQRFIAAANPATTLWLLRELRRLTRVERQYHRMCTQMRHLDEFLERRGLSGEARRFAAVREQLSEIDWAS